MMKKSFSLLLVLTLILSSFSLVASAATGTSQVISDFNIMPQSCSADSDSLVTRRDFAFTIANILGSGEAAPRATDFVDVGEELEDSGYIYYATVNGFLVPQGNMFCPDDAITLHDFNETVVKLLAYETIAQANGGGADGNLKTVRDLKIYEGVTIKDYDTVTVKQYRQLIYNLMTASVADFNYSYDQDGNINLYRTGSTKTVLSQYFGISRYYGSIVEVNNDKPSAKFNVTKNVSEANPELLTVGSDYYFLSNGKVDMNFYKNIPVEVWISKEGKIVYIAPQPNVEVFYDVIYSVNDDTNPNNAYALNLVDEIEFNRDEREYKIDATAKISYNGAVTRTPVKMAGKYAKIVIINNKVTYIETWNLQEGGFIQEINNSYISYIKGEALGRLKKIGEYSDISVIIEGRSTDRTQIKPGSLFYYYQTDKMLVIVVSEKTIVGNLDSMATGELEIGRHFYSTNGDIYVSTNGTDFYTNDFSDVFNTQVICYVDIFDNIRYMQASGYLNKSNEFTAYIIGSSQKGFDDIKIKVQKIYPVLEEAIIVLPSDLPASKLIDNPATTVNNLSTVFASAASIASNALKWSTDKMTATEKLFKFTVNDEGVITQIAEPDYYLLFGEEHDITYLDANKDEQTVRVPRVPVVDVPLDHFPGDERAIYMHATTATTPNSDISIGYDGTSTLQLFYIHNERFVVLTNIDGKLGVVEKTYDELLAHGTFNQVDSEMMVNIAMLAEPGSIHPQVWFLYGNTDKIYQYNARESAVIDSITQRYDEETEKAYYELVVDNGEQTWKLDSLDISPAWSLTHYRPTGEPAPSKLEVGMNVHYNDGAIFCNNGIYITGVEEYPKSADGSDMTIEEWHQNIAYGYLKSTVKKITSYRLFLENGATYHVGNNCYITGVKFKNGKVEYVALTAADIEAGSTIYFNRTLNVNSIYVELQD